MRLSFFFFAGVGLNGMVFIRVVIFRCIAFLRGLLIFRLEFDTRCVPNYIRNFVLDFCDLNFYFVFYTRLICILVRIRGDFVRLYGASVLYDRFDL